MNADSVQGRLFSLAPQNLHFVRMRCTLLVFLTVGFQHNKEMSKNLKAFVALDKRGLANQYVVIVEGKVLGKGFDIEKMLKKARTKYPSAIPFVAKIPDERLMVL